MYTDRVTKVISQVRRKYYIITRRYYRNALLLYDIWLR